MGTEKILWKSTMSAYMHAVKLRCLLYDIGNEFGPDLVDKDIESATQIIDHLKPMMLETAKEGGDRDAETSGLCPHSTGDD